MRTLLYKCQALVNNRPLSVVRSQQGALRNDIIVTPNMLVKGQNTNILPDQFRWKQSMKTDSRKGIYQIFRERESIVKEFQHHFETTYHRMLKFRNKWGAPFTHEIPVGTYVLLREDDLNKTKRGTLTPAIVTKVHHRDNGLISKLSLRVKGHPEEVVRELRSLSMTEADFNELTRPDHSCTLHEEKDPQEGNEESQNPEEGMEEDAAREPTVEE